MHCSSPTEYRSRAEKVRIKARTESVTAIHQRGRQIWLSNVRANVRGMLSNVSEMLSNLREMLSNLYEMMSNVAAARTSGGSLASIPRRRGALLMEKWLSHPCAF